ncbi:PTAC2 [Symbiodinium sp. CCMP2592]|nr:PTAC2 [Symbiodinium sp. CCMP2592]
MASILSIVVTVLAVICGMRNIHHDEVMTVGSAIAACSTAGRWKAAITLLSDTVPSRLAVNRILLQSAASACEVPRKWEAAMSLLRDAVFLRQASIQTYTVVIGACGRASFWEMALALFAEVRPSDVDLFALSAAIVACTQRWEVACSLLSSAGSFSLAPDTCCINAAISACENAGVWEHALSLLSLLWRRRAASVVSFNTGMSACKVQWRHCLRLFWDMIEGSLCPDSATFNAAITACEQGGQWQRLLCLLTEMELRNVAKEVVTYTSAISACAKGSATDQAAELLQRMEAEQLLPNVVTYAALTPRSRSISSFSENLVQAAFRDLHFLRDA